MSVGNLEKLSNLLDQAEKKIKSDNERSMYDTNRHWEKIAMYILNITYDWSLQDLNLIRKNFPGIDLGDYERHIGVQVTKDSSENKINSTFKKIKENKIGGHPISEDYYKIYFFITGKKEECDPSKLDIGENFLFSQDAIIDFTDFKGIECRMYEHLKILFNLAELNESPMILFRNCHTKEEQDALETKILHRSWLRLNQTHTIISIHAVIREVCRIELQPDDENCRQFLSKLRESAKNNHNQELIKPIADTMGKAAEILPDKEGTWNRVAGNDYRILGNYRKALDYLKKAVEKCLWKEDMDLADLYSDIGNTYKSCNLSGHNGNPLSKVGETL